MTIQQVQFRQANAPEAVLNATVGSAYHRHGGVMVLTNAVTVLMNLIAQV